MTNITFAQRIAASGLKMEARDAKVAATDILHARTPTFKGELLWRTSQVDSLGNYSGVTSQIVRRNDETGELEPTDSNFDFALDDQGFFVGIRGDAGTETAFFRDGRSQIDKDGYLQSATGYYYLAWPTDINGGLLGPGGVGQPTSQITELERVRFDPASTYHVSTSTVSLKQNLVNAAVGASRNAQFTVIDGVGATHVVNIAWEKVSANTWEATLTCADADDIEFSYGVGVVAERNKVQITFDGTGAPASFNDPTGAALAGGAIPDLDIDWPAPVANSTIAFSLGTVGDNDGYTMLGDNEGTDYSVLQLSTNGVQLGYATEISIDENGIASYLYSNGIQIPRYRLALAKFPNARGLTPKTGNLFSPSNTSGDYTLGTAKSTGYAGVVTRAVESSIVDQADALIKLNQASSGFMWNAQCFQKLDEMLGHLANLNR